MVNYLMTHLGLETKDHLTAVGDLIWPPLTGLVVPLVADS